MKLIDDRNPAKAFVFRNLLFFILYIITAYFIITMPVGQNAGILFHSKKIFIIIPLLFIGIVVLFARSMVHMDESSIDKDKARKDFVLSGILFHASICLFFLVIFIWIISLGGVPNSAFSGLLTSAPVFFIFGSPKHYRDILDDGSTMVDRQLYKLSFWENLFKWMTYIVFIMSVMAFDWSAIGRMINIDGLKNPFFNFVVAESTNIKACKQYNIMSLVIFLGSVVAVIMPYFIELKKRQIRNSHP